MDISYAAVSEFIAVACERLWAKTPDEMERELRRHPYHKPTLTSARDKWASSNCESGVGNWGCAQACQPDEFRGKVYPTTATTPKGDKQGQEDQADESTAEESQTDATYEQAEKLSLVLDISLVPESNHGEIEVATWEMIFTAPCQIIVRGLDLESESARYAARH